MAETCNYSEAYRGRCGAPGTVGERCERHAAVTCQCGAPATHECSYAGQFVCGRPLCDECEGWEDSSKSSGAWGFMNHLHRRKAQA